MLGRSEALDADRNPVEQYTLHSVEITNKNSRPDVIKPTFEWVGGIHGADDAAGTELLLRLAHYLVAFADGGPAAPPLARQLAWLLDNTRLVIVPSLNPWGAAHRRRANAMGVDLDLSFPPSSPLILRTDPDVEAAAREKCSDGEVGPLCTWLDMHKFIAEKKRLTGRLPLESAAYMAHALDSRAILGASLRSGALGVSTDLDACEATMDVCPADSTALEPDLCKPEACNVAEHVRTEWLARQYAARHARMALTQRGTDAAGRSVEFAAGTVNGAAWSPHLGSLRDWLYWSTPTQMLDVLVDEGPGAAHPALLDVLFLENRASMLALMKQVHMGIKGRLVTEDGETGLDAMLSCLHPAAVPGTEPRLQRTMREPREGSFTLLMTPDHLYCFHVSVQPHNASLSTTLLAVRLAVSNGTLDADTWQEASSPATIVVPARAATTTDSAAQVLNGTMHVTQEDLVLCKTVWAQRSSEVAAHRAAAHKPKQQASDQAPL